MHIRWTKGFLLFAITLLVYLVSINGTWATDHATSYVQLGYALWSDHSVILGTAPTFTPHTVDDFVFGGHYYSALAPGTVFLAFPFLAIAFALQGGYTVFGPVLLSTEIFVSLTGALAAYFTYKIAEMFFRKSTALFIGFAFSFSSISWSQATFFFQGEVSAMLVTFGVFLALKAQGASKRRALLVVLCGLVVGLAFTVDYVTAVLVPIIGSFLYLGGRAKARSLVRSVAPFLVGALPGFILIGTYNYVAFGNPLFSTEQLYLGKTSVLGGFTNPVISGLWLDLLSPARGLFFFVPLTILGMIGYFRGLRISRPMPAFLLFLAIFLGILLPYSMWYSPEGGVSYGPRFIMAAIPFALLPAGLVVDSAKGREVLLFDSLFVVGAVTNGFAALTTAIPQYWGPGVSPFLATELPNFLAGKLDAWWSGAAGTYLPVGVLNVLAAGSAIPLLLIHLERASERPEPISVALGAKPVS